MDEEVRGNRGMAGLTMRGSMGDDDEVGMARGVLGVVVLVVVVEVVVLLW